MIRWICGVSRWSGGIPSKNKSEVLAFLALNYVTLLIECRWNTIEEMASVSRLFIEWSSSNTIKRTALLRHLPEYSCLRPHVLIPS